MKIKYLGYTTFLITSDSLDIITDPKVSIEAGVKLNNLSADLVIATQDSIGVEIKPVHRKDVFHITKAGEYELSDIMVQRPLNTDYYMIDDEFVRVVYIGPNSANIDTKGLKDLGDVDVLLLPVGNGDMFPSYEVLEKIISIVDPIKLVPFGYNNGKVGTNLKSLDDFIKSFGFNITEETTLKVDSVPESEDRNMEVVVLK